MIMLLCSYADHAKGMVAVTLTILIAVLAVVPMIVIVPMVAWHLVAHRYVLPTISSN
jgi:hypothetical protein